MRYESLLYPKLNPLFKEVRNFKHFVEVDFINDLKRVSWQNVECFDDPNLAWQAWKSDFKVIPQYCIAHPYCARFLRQ